MNVHIVSFPRGENVTVANEPAVVCRQEILPQSLHYWRGASGQRSHAAMRLHPLNA